MIFALVGNQNCGKTTLFNALTGSNQHVGNFPGVTVEQKSGEVKGVKNCSVVDLPGIYSLRPYTQEEIVSRDFIINQKPDGIINIVDATNIERNLYLTLQLLELRVPMVLALNMMDEVRANGGAIDVRKMSAALGIPVVPIVAAKGEGVSELVDQAMATARGKVMPKVTDFCGEDSAGSPLYPRRCSSYCRPCGSHRAFPPASARRSLSRAGTVLQTNWGLTRTKRSCLSTASCRWRMRRGWTEMRRLRTCAIRSLRTLWSVPSSNAMRARNTHAPYV